MSKLAKNSIAAGLTTLLITTGMSFAANGATPTESHATGRFLSGTIGGTNLDALAELKGVGADNPGDTGPNTNPLSLTVLQAIPVNIPGGLNLNVADFLSPGNGSAGVANQYASASSTASAAGASGAVSDTGAILAPGNGQFPANAKISLDGGLLDGINDNLAGVDLTVGALSSFTKIVNTDTLTRDYQISSLKLDLKVPLLKDLLGDVGTAVDGLPAANDITLSPAQLCPILGTTSTVTSTTLLAQLNSLGLKPVADLIAPILSNALLPINSVNLCDVNPLLQIVGGLSDDVIGKLISVKVTGLDAVTKALNVTSSGGVAIDLTNGTITLDLAQVLIAAGEDLNNLDPNTDIAAFLTKNLVSQKIQKVIDDAVKKIGTAVGKVNVIVSVAGTEALNLQNSTGLAGLVSTFTASLASVTTNLTQALVPVDNFLATLAPDLAKIVKLTGNNQSTSSAPTLPASSSSASISAVGDYYRTSALKIDVLGGDLASIDLAASEAGVVNAAVTADDGPGAAATAADDGPGDNTNGAAATAGDGANTAAIADADSAADADAAATLPDAGAPNLLPFFLLGIALLAFGLAVLLNERRRFGSMGPDNLA